MKNLVYLLLAFTVVFSSCKEETQEEEQSLKDTNYLQITSHEMLDTLKRGETISWTSSDRSDYHYSITMAPVSHSDEDSVWHALQTRSFASAKGLSDNSFSNFQPQFRDQYIAVLVVKYPNTLSFQQWISQIDETELQKYVETIILVGDGDMPIGTSCSTCCDVGSYTCPDGEHTQTCKCVDNFCWKKLCGAYSKLEPMKEI